MSMCKQYFIKLLQKYMGYNCINKYNLFIKNCIIEKKNV